MGQGSSLLQGRLGGLGELHLPGMPMGPGSAGWGSGKLWMLRLEKTGCSREGPWDCGHTGLEGCGLCLGT